MEYKNSNLDTLLISESNYSYEFFDEPFMKMKNDKTRQIYQLDEKEKDIYEQQEELGKKMLELISNKQRQFKHKYNKIQKQDDLYHKEYNYFNDKIINILNQYNNNQNNYIINDNYNNYFNNGSYKDLNPIFDVFDNKWIFPKNKPLNNKSFKAKCDIKSCEKKIIKNRNNNSNNNNNKFLRKNYPRSKSKTYRKTITSLNSFNTKNIKTNNKSDNIKNNIHNKNKSKTERLSNFEFNKKKNNDKKYKVREKSGTRRTTVGTANSSMYEGNKIDDFKNIDYFIPDIKDNQINKDNLLLKKPDYSKYLTKENFYPKSYRIDINKGRLTSDEILHETKTSYRDNRMMKDLYDKAFKKCNYQPNLCNFNNNEKNYV